MDENIFQLTKRTLVGTPIPNSEASHQRLSKKKALATFSSDALSSVAYATEEILMVLMLAGAAALQYSIPISLAIITLLVVVYISYRQTIYAYPSGGGAYIVARENLGEWAGLTAAAALLTDYVLTVAVSVAAGIAALTSAFPSLEYHNVLLCLVSIFALTVMNLRGIKESATIFALPTYAFIIGVFAMLGLGSYELANGTFTHIVPSTLAIQKPLTVFLLLRAFSSGCTAMTGVEAVSNGIPVFQHPESRNAAITLLVMVFILSGMFFGITFLSHYHGIVPTESETVISQLARSVFGTSRMYYFIQFSTMGILILAANTSYADFPRLSSILAQDRFLPRQFASQGDRLVFSNGILILGALSGLLIILFQASTHALIPLYAVGVFLSFTLSQTGMVKHWLIEHKPGWLGRSAINATGALATGVVTLVFTITKFSHGAWIIIIIIPLFIYGFRIIKAHYIDVGKQITLAGVDAKALIHSPVKHAVVLPISGIHRGLFDALEYARTIGVDVRALYVELDAEQVDWVQREWSKWVKGVPLFVLKSPYRSVISPILKYIEDVRDVEHCDIVTVIIPEFVPASWWQNLLHNQTAFLLRAALTFKKNVVVTSIRYHLK